MKSTRCLFVFLLLLLVQTLAAQPTQKALEEYRQRYKRAMAYSELSQYGPSMEELTTVISFATGNHLEEQRIDATITLAELMRRTHDFEKGLQLLFQLDIFQPSNIQQFVNQKSTTTVAAG